MDLTRRLTKAALGFAICGVASIGTTGCDEPSAPRSPTGSSATTTQNGSTATAAPANAAGGRTSLIAIPFTADLPAGWAIETLAASKIGIHGHMPSGEVAILLSTRPALKPEAVTQLVKEYAQPATGPSGANTNTRVSQRGAMRILEQVNRIGPPGGDPDVVPYTWTVQFIVPTSGVDFAVYEMNADLSERMYTQDAAFLRKIFDSVQPETPSAAGLPALP